MKLKIGDSAPDFKLPDQEGIIHSLSDYRGKWVLLYFYPKDNTTGCTKEACQIRDYFSDFKKHHAVVLGMSADSPKSHHAFAKELKLPFTLLADEEKKTLKAYGAWGKKKFMGREYNGIYRISFLIDPKGKIVKIYEKVNPETHATEVLTDLAVLKENSSG